MSFNHRVPRELQQEDRWFKLFTPKQAIAAGVCGAVGILGFRILFGLFGFIPAVSVFVVYAIICGLLITLKINSQNYMIGGGQYLAMIILRYLYRRTQQILYVKHYTEPEDE